MSQAANYLVARGDCEKLTEIADPDVAGLGVVISFLTLITFSLLAILMAYFCRWLPEEKYSPVDDAFVRGIQSFLSSARFPRLEKNQRAFEYWARNRKDIRLQRIQAFEHFLRAVSDQQLVTAVALVIVTTFMTFKGDISSSFSVYSFQIATRLGYFSCIVHFYITSLLPERPGASKGLRRLWLALVVVLIVLLVVCMIISDSVTFRFNRHISVECARRHFRLVDTERPGYARFSDEVVVISNLIVLILVIFLRYWGRFPELPWGRADRPRQSPCLPFAGDGEKADKRVEARIASLLAVLRKLNHGARGTNSGSWTLVFKIWADSISTSLLWDIVWLPFYLAFGMGTFWNFYWDADVRLEMKPNFGQVMPLILLCLPFQSAWEAFSASSATCKPSYSRRNVNCGNPSSDGIQLGRLTPCHLKSRSGAMSEPMSGCDEDSVPLQRTAGILTGSPGDKGGILQVADELGISLRWFEICTFLCWVAVMVWALMFAGVIPGYGAFYVCIVACFVVGVLMMVLPCVLRGNE